MKIQTRATTVLERTSHYLRVGVLKQKPAWYDVVGSHPPSTDLTKKPKVFDLEAQKQDPTESLFRKSDERLFKTRVLATEKAHQNNSISRVPKLQFLEDELRDVFYHQHPWEFSRPKTLIENSGNDNAHCDWSHMLQLNKPLDGESVVQRTLWLLKNKKVSDLFEAYDKARFEFYRLRMEEEMNSLVSKEESAMYGAIYPSTNMEWGLKQEQEYVDVWAKVASDKTKLAQVNSGKSMSSSTAAEDTAVVETSIWEEEVVIEEEKK